MAGLVNNSLSGSPAMLESPSSSSNTVAALDLPGTNVGRPSRAYRVSHLDLAAPENASNNAPVGRPAFAFIYRTIKAENTEAADFRCPSVQPLSRPALKELATRMLQFFNRLENCPPGEEIPLDRARKALKGAAWVYINPQGDSTENMGVVLLAGQPLGSGGQGIVYMAMTQEGVSCALKVRNKPSVPEEDRESILLRSFSGSPHVLQRIGFAPWYCADELCPNGNLFDVTIEELRQDRERLKNINLGILEGINDIHSRDIVHWDIKSENILLKTPDHVVIADFGSATTTNEPPRGGTQIYSSPEQIEYYLEIANGAPKDPLPYPHKSDIWQTMLVLAKINQGNLSGPFQERITAYTKFHAELWNDVRQDTGLYMDIAATHLAEIRKKRQEEGLDTQGLFSDLTPTTHLERLLVRMSVFDPRDRINAQDALDYFREYCVAEMNIQQ